MAACGSDAPRPDAAPTDGRVSDAAPDTIPRSSDASALDASSQLDVDATPDVPPRVDARVATDAATPVDDGSRPLGCAASPHRCGYPDETSTGVPVGVVLRRVPADVTSGPGWTFDTRYASVEVRTEGAVLDGLDIAGSIETYSDHVTIRNCRITATGDTWAIGLRHASYVTIEDTQILSPLADGPQRLEVGIKDIYGDTTGSQIRRTDIQHASTGIQIANGVFEDNYIHHYGFHTGDHLNGISVGGGDIASLIVRHNTLFDDHDQTDAIALFQDFGTEANKVIDDNFVAGGSYSIYGGSGSHATTGIRVTNNRIGVQYFPHGGSYGWMAAWTHEPGNELSGNYWDDTGHSADADFVTHR